MAIKGKTRLDAFGTGDPAVDAALGAPASPPSKKTTVYDRMARARSMTPAQRRKVQFDASRAKVTYDLPPDMIQIVDQLAQACKAPRGQVAAYLMAYGLRALQDGSANLGWALVTSPSVRFMARVTLPDFPGEEDLKTLVEELKARW